MTRHADKEEVILHLVSVPCKVPIANRVRSVLKRLLRDYGFRSTKVAGDALLAPEERTPAETTRQPSSTENAFSGAVLGPCRTTTKAHLSGRASTVLYGP